MTADIKKGEKMKILEINKYFYRKGGSEAYFFNIIELLESHDHEIGHFSMKHERNQPSIYSDFFVDEVNYEHQTLLEKVIGVKKILYSNEANTNLRLLLEEIKPDVAHLHNVYHQLPLSIIIELKKQGIPIILTAHDYKLICPAYSLYSNNQVCEKCKGHKYYRCLTNRCMKDSLTGSAVCTLEMYLHHGLKTFLKIDRVITPSQFQQNKFIEFGYPADKIIQLYNFVDLEAYEANYHNEDYFLYFGRISSEKGIMTLLKAMKQVKKSRLLIVGDGPMKEKCEMFARTNALENVEFLGYKSGDALKKIISNAKFITINSELYENNPMTVIEAMALGKGIIGSRIGGIPELIQENISGYLYEAGNENDLAQKINWMLEDETIITNFGKASRAFAETHFDKEKHYKTFMNIVNAVVKT